MQNAALSEIQLTQLIELAKSRIENCTQALDRAHGKYMNPKDDAEYKKASEDMVLWGDRQWVAMGELSDLKKELDQRVSV